MLWALVFAKAFVLVYAESLVSGICRESLVPVCVEAGLNVWTVMVLVLTLLWYRVSGKTCTVMSKTLFQLFS